MMNKYYKIILILPLILLTLTGCHPSKKKDKPAPAPTLTTGENRPVTNPEVLPPSEQPITKSIKLSWDAPVERENGDRLYAYEIGGYEIVWQKEGETQWNSIVLYDDQSYMLEEHTIPELTPGTYFFAIACFDIDGLYSRFTDPLIKEVN
ncbi:fibronectin type III domain-containing protein [Bacteriovorax sp. Seq25_V]|uniref:fibronectin type III domain-containing protein n=1 Tax=Bacteriovorax sp. Seq25_V TaxID=1201288 RepID=UPI00038A25B5|nr:fibronectin type III domain-containing protein [Bacteriovorax sp. Seq25_V]EQC45989.1 putative lipoprotein [Bacteriovorax sp. Seq25_V]